jgi:two-component system, cell cycle response regulator DivK
VSAGRTPLILLVEDNETIRHAFGILLEDHGYRVQGAADGAEALRMAAAEPPDLVLMDLGLPDMNGLEVTRRLKADVGTRDAVIVAITGRALETDQEACRAAGCAGYLAKPINTADLLRTIPAYLGSAGRQM